MNRNGTFYWLLHEVKAADGKPWTVAKLAAAIMSGRAHVNQVLNNKLDSERTRKRLVLVFKANFQHWPEILLALDWNEDGTRRTAAATNVPAETFHVEHADK